MISQFVKKFIFGRVVMVRLLRRIYKKLLWISNKFCVQRQSDGFVKTLLLFYSLASQKTRYILQRKWQLFVTPFKFGWTRLINIANFIVYHRMIDELHPLIAEAKNLCKSNKQCILFINTQLVTADGRLPLLDIFEEMCELHGVELITLSAYPIKTNKQKASCYVLGEYEESVKSWRICLFRLRTINFSCVAINGISASAMLPAFHALYKVPALFFVNELSTSLPDPSFAELHRYVTQIIFPSECLRKEASKIPWFLSENTSVLPLCFPNPLSFESYNREQVRSNIRKKLSLSEEAFIVVGWGVWGAADGLDVFENTARSAILGSQFPQDVHFVWISSKERGVSDQLHINLFEHSALKSRLHGLILEDDASVMRAMAGADVFYDCARNNYSSKGVHYALMANRPVLTFDYPNHHCEMFFGSPYYAKNVFSFGNLHAAIESISALRNDPVFYSQLVEYNIRSVIGRYSFEQYTSKLLSFVTDGIISKTNQSSGLGELGCASLKEEDV